MMAAFILLRRPYDCNHYILVLIQEIAGLGFYHLVLLQKPNENTKNILLF